MLSKKLSLVSNRTLSRYNYLTKTIPVRKQMSFLEIGGATGESYIIINKHKKPSVYTIIEPSSTFNFSAKNIVFINDLFENVENKNIFAPDIIIMFHVLEHIFNLDEFMNKIKLLQSSYFYFEIPNCKNEQVRNDSLTNHPHYHHFTADSIEKLLLKFGLKKFTLDEIEPISYHPYKKVSKAYRYFNRLIRKNEKITENGLYIRGIFKF